MYVDPAMLKIRSGPRRVTPDARSGLGPPAVAGQRPTTHLTIPAVLVANDPFPVPCPSRLHQGGRAVTVGNSNGETLDRYWRPVDAEGEIFGPVHSSRSGRRTPSLSGCGSTVDVPRCAAGLSWNGGDPHICPAAIQ